MFKWTKKAPKQQDEPDVPPLSAPLPMDTTDPADLNDPPTPMWENAPLPERPEAEQVAVPDNWETPPISTEPEVLLEQQPILPETPSWEAPPPVFDLPEVIKTTEATPEPVEAPIEPEALPAGKTDPNTPKKIRTLPIKLVIQGLGLLLLLWLIGHCHRDIPLETLKSQYAYSDSRFLPIDGMEIHCRVSGRGEPLLLLHDSYSSLRTWAVWHEQLSRQYQVISVDLPGFGLTGPHPQGRYDIAMYRNLVDSIANTLHIGRFNLVGNGTGAQIAWYYASQSPQRLQRLILIAPKGFDQDEAGAGLNAFAKIPVLNYGLLYVTPKFYSRWMLEKVYANNAAITPALVQEQFDLMLRPGNRRAILDRARTQEPPPPTTLLSDIDLPTLLVWGADDAITSFKQAYDFHPKMRGAILRKYRQAGHWPQQECPEQVVKDVALFLRGEL